MERVSDVYIQSYNDEVVPLKRKDPLYLISLLDAKKSYYVRLKYVLEYIFALGAFLVLMPFMLFVAALIKLDSPGKVFFRHKRYGLLGQPFYVYKFRTMIENAHQLQIKYSDLNEMKGGKLFKSDADPRVTRIGRILRKFSIDELPQLLNILKGEMTVIGPRPISTPLEEYEDNQLIKFTVKPGLGAIWQAYNRGDKDFVEWMRMDREYVENISFFLDLKLLLKITKKVITGEGAR